MNYIYTHICIEFTVTLAKAWGFVCFRVSRNQ